ncbi:MAG: hypothetical protein U0792_07070 [Gemmataceae bacterium]
MSVSYTCPNPDCGATLKAPNRVAVGKSIKCPKCSRSFTPETDDDEAPAEVETFKLADDDAPKKPAAKPSKPAAKAAKKEEAPPPPPPPPPPPAKSPFADDDEESEESIKRGYGVQMETEEEKKEAEKHKPKFTETQEKFKKSARGPAMALLVTPSNLMTAAGLITVAFALLWFVQGAWPLVFSDAPPGEEELEEAIVDMIIGMTAFVWGAVVCLGASHMQELGSYPLAMTGAVMSVPALVGIMGILALQNPAVKAGFAESSGGPDDDEDEDEEKDDDEEDDEDDDDDDEEEETKKPKAKKAAKPAKPAKKTKPARKRKKDDDDDDDDEDDE